MATDTEPISAEFNWQAHPAGERRAAAVGGGAVVLATAAAVFVSFQSIAWGVLAVIVLVGALNRFYFRSRFQIDADGITARYPLRSKRFRWDDVKRFMVDAHGGFLSTRADRSWLDAYQGLHVLFGRDRPTVIEQIRSHLRKGVAS